MSNPRLRQPRFVIRILVLKPKRPFSWVERRCWRHQPLLWLLATLLSLKTDLLKRSRELRSSGFFALATLRPTYDLTTPQRFVISMKFFSPKHHQIWLFAYIWILCLGKLLLWGKRWRSSRFFSLDNIGEWTPLNFNHPSKIISTKRFSVFQQ